jgi:hypothetical protein
LYLSHLWLQPPVIQIFGEKLHLDWTCEEFSFVIIP